MLKIELLIHVMLDTLNFVISTNFTEMQIQINYIKHSPVYFNVQFKWKNKEMKGLIKNQSL